MKGPKPRRPDPIVINGQEYIPYHHPKFTMWQASLPCEKCGKLRAVNLVRGKPVSSICGSCARKNPDRMVLVKRALTGRPFSDEHKRSLSETWKKGRAVSDALRANWRVGRVMSEASRILMSKQRRGKPCPPHVRAALRQGRIRAWNDPVIRERNVASIQRASKDPKRRAKLSVNKKAYWASLTMEQKNKHLANARIAIGAHPNKLETFLLAIINEACPNSYRYSGDGTFMVGGMNPDYVHYGDEQKVIEAFGEYWHRGQNPEHRIQAFAKHGYKCLVLWEQEVYSWSRDKLIEVIQNFEDSRQYWPFYRTNEKVLR